MGLTCLGHEQTICVLNIHASVIASKYDTGSDRFYALFKNFIRLFQDSSYDESYLDRAPTSVTKAYHEFRIASNTEVTRNALRRGRARWSKNCSDSRVTL